MKKSASRRFGLALWVLSWFTALALGVALHASIVEQSAGPLLGSTAPSSRPSADPSARAAVDARAPLAVTSSPWVQLDLRKLHGTWIGALRGDAIVAHALVPGAYRAEFVEGRAKSKTPWNMKIWAPRAGHMEADTVIMGCGFYRALHEMADGGAPWRKAYCRGYGLPAGAPQATTMRLESHTDSDRIRVRIGSYIDAELVRPAQ